MGLSVDEVGIWVDEEGAGVIAGGPLGDEATGIAEEESSEGKSVDPGVSVGRLGCMVGILCAAGASVVPPPSWGAVVGAL